MTNFRVLAGLPPYGAQAVPFPRSWAAAAREGLVVEFTGEDGIAWVGNLGPGIGGLDEVRRHPNASDVRRCCPKPPERCVHATERDGNKLADATRLVGWLPKY